MGKPDNPLISIIIPVYNSGKYLKRCISSIQKQSIEDIEIIIVDDGSTDDSFAICKELAEDDTRIKVYHKANGGAASARNVGLDMAAGKYIGFVDSDDFIDANMYEELLKVMKSGDYRMVDCLTRECTEDGDLLHEPEQNGQIVIKTCEESIRQSLMCKENVSLATRLFSKEAIGDRRIPEGKRVEDFAFMLYIFDHVGYNVIYNKCLYNIVRRKGSVTRSGGGFIYLDALYFLEKTKYDILDAKYELSDAIVYYRYKMIYYLFVNLADSEEITGEIKDLRNFIRKNYIKMLLNKDLLLKEKMLLLLCCVSMRLPHRLFILKNSFFNRNTL